MNTQALSLESQLFTIEKSFEHQNEMPFFFSPFIGINIVDKDIRNRNCTFVVTHLYLFHCLFFFLMAILKGKNYMLLVSESER